MHSTLVLPSLMLVAGAATVIPAVQNGANRSLLYWVILPTLVIGAAAFVAQFRAF